MFDEQGRVIYWPAKKANKTNVLEMLASKFEAGRFYTEKEVNAILSMWHTFDDFYLLRRELINNWFLSRTASGSRYWVEETVTYSDIAIFLEQRYSIGSIKSLMRLRGGYGSVCYYVQAALGEYIYKVFHPNMKDYAQHEVEILCLLKDNGLPVSKIIPAKSCEYLLEHDSSLFHLQQFVEGKIYPRNTAPEWLLYESSAMLGKIQKALSLLPPLPIGMGQNFFDTMTPEKAIENYENTLKLATDKGDLDIANAIGEKIRILSSFSGYPFDLSTLTCKNTHGDYKVQQLICGKNNINAVIDFTSACTQPLCWEVIRGYSTTDPVCADGSIDIEHFKKYISYFLEFGSLSAFDIQTMPMLYYYQILVSDYFKQYYAFSHPNRQLLLSDAFHSLCQCQWFERNIDRLSAQLKNF